MPLVANLKSSKRKLTKKNVRMVASLKLRSDMSSSITWRALVTAGISDSKTSFANFTVLLEHHYVKTLSNKSCFSESFSLAMPVTH